MKRRIDIYRDNVWAGSGTINSEGTIEDCPAVLAGETPLGYADADASEETYEMIEDAIEIGVDTVTRPDGVYSWAIKD